MKIGGQRILSMGFLITALVLFTAMHFLTLDRFENDRGWEMWNDVGFMIWNVCRDPSILGYSENTLRLFLFPTLSLLIVASPFFGAVWIKSLLAWSMVVIVSGMAACGLWVWLLLTFRGSLTVDMSWGGWCLMFSPLLNFLGLLLARPQSLKKSGPAEFLSPP